MKILSIEDDDALIALLTKSLSAQNHIVDAIKIDLDYLWKFS